MAFQSLGRDSVHSSQSQHILPAEEVAVSIPRSGFCSFKLVQARTRVRCGDVSIPRSGFCSFKRRSFGMQAVELCGFNPSVGILFIQAVVYLARWVFWLVFQSLGRDSVHSSCLAAYFARNMRPFQSLGRDSVHSSRSAWLATPMASDGFNPSVGILFIQARR